MLKTKSKNPPTGSKRPKSKTTHQLEPQPLLTAGVCGDCGGCGSIAVRRLLDAAEAGVAGEGGD